MRVIRMELVTLLLAAAIGFPASGAAQTRANTPAPPSAPEPSSQPNVEVQLEPEHWGRPVLRVGQDYTLGADDAIREAVVLYGDALIHGRIDRDLVVVFGKAQLSSTASIEGSLIVVGGSAAVTSGARVRQDLVIVGGAFDAPPGFAPEGQQIIVGSAALGEKLRAIVPWMTRGLLWGRPIVPDLPWVWGVAGIFFLVYLVLNLLLHHPVGAAAETLAAKPLTAFGVGLLVLLLTGPVCALLAVSVVGIAVVPFVLCAIFAAWLLGKIGVARWIGSSVVREDTRESRWQSLRSFVIGSAVICAAYMVPLLGFVAWTMVGVFGLGGATLAFIAAYRRENPAAPPRAPRVAAPPAPYQPAGALESEINALSNGPGPSAMAAAPAVASDIASFPHADFLSRLAAFALDVILVLIAQELLGLTRRDSAIFLLLLGYHIGFWTWKGTTVGGIICQLRVVRVDGAPLRFVDALVRGLSSIFSLAVLGVGGLWIIKDPERQAWHDKIAGTYVVKVPRHWPI